jgi:hypothetical protein
VGIARQVVIGAKAISQQSFANRYTLLRMLAALSIENVRQNDGDD